MKNKTVKIYTSKVIQNKSSSYSHKIVVRDLVKEFQMAAFIFAGVTVQVVIL